MYPLKTDVIHILYNVVPLNLNKSMREYIVIFSTNYAVFAQRTL